MLTVTFHQLHFR